MDLKNTSGLLFNGSSQIKAQILEEIRHRLNDGWSDPFVCSEEFKQESPSGESSICISLLSKENLIKYLPEDVFDWHRSIMRIGKSGGNRIAHKANPMTSAFQDEIARVSLNQWTEWISIMDPASQIRNFSCSFIPYFLKNLIETDPFHITLPDIAYVQMNQAIDLLFEEHREKSTCHLKRQARLNALISAKAELELNSKYLSSGSILLGLVINLLREHQRDSKGVVFAVEHAMQMLILLISKSNWDRSIRNVQISYECVWHYAKVRLKNDPGFNFIDFLDKSAEGRAFNEPVFQSKVQSIENQVRKQVSSWLLRELANCIQLNQE